MGKSEIASACRIFVDVFCGVFVWLLLSPILLSVFLPLFLLRVGHHLVAKFVRRDLIPLWGGLDGTFTISPTSAKANMNTTQVWWVEGNLDINVFRHHFFNSFLATPDLRHKYRNLFCYFVRWGLYIFKKPLDSVNLEEMIMEGPRLDDEGQVETFLGKWMALNDYGEKPCWKIIIIYFPDKSLLLWKMDHGLTDGYTFVHLVSVLSGIKAPYIVKERDYPLLTKIRYTLTFPKLAIESGVKSILSGPLPYPDNTPQTHELFAPQENDWLFSVTTLPLDKIKQARRLAGCHFNTVLGTIQAGALRRLCLEENDIPETQLPRHIFIPSPTAWPKHHAMLHGGMCNHIYPLRESNPLQRLREGEASLNYADEVGLPAGFRWLFVPLAWTLPSIVEDVVLKASVWLGLWSFKQFLSPLMLAPQPYTLCKHKVIHLYLPVHAPNFLKSVHVYVVPVSVDGKLEVAVSGTRKIFGDQKTLDRFTKIYLWQEKDSLIEHLIKDEGCV